MILLFFCIIFQNENLGIFQNGINVGENAYRHKELTHK